MFELFNFQITIDYNRQRKIKVKKMLNTAGKARLYGIRESRADFPGCYDLSYQNYTASSSMSARIYIFSASMNSSMLAASSAPCIGPKKSG